MADFLSRFRVPGDAKQAVEGLRGGAGLMRA
jgi:hypothetical protein